MHLQNIRIMPNMSKKLLSDEQLRFVDNVASLLVPWGVPQMSARIYGCLLLHFRPLSLDQIAECLEISKSTASVAARMLENHMLIRRQGEKGSKRVLYVVSDSSAGLLADKSFLLGEFGRLLETRANEVTSGDAATRMRAIGRFYLSMREAIDALIDELASGDWDNKPHSTHGKQGLV